MTFRVTSIIDVPFGVQQAIRPPDSSFYHIPILGGYKIVLLTDL
jgi:hypothetical protein